MIDFFKTQLDYIHFFYGFAFILLGAVCIIVLKDKKNIPPLPWKWLGLFGIAHGVHESFALFTDGLGDSESLSSIRTIVSLSSFIFLTEFGRSGIRPLKDRKPRILLYLILAVVTSFGAAAGVEGLNVAGRYSFGLIGGLLSACTLFLLARTVGSIARKWLTAGSIALGIYALTIGLVVQFTPFFPALFITRDVFFQTFGFPIHLVRGILAVIATSSLWVFSQLPFSEQEAHDYRSRRIFMPAAILISIIAAGWIMTKVIGNRAKNEEVHEGSLFISALTTRLLDVMEEAEFTALEQARSVSVLDFLKTGSASSLARADTVMDSCRRRHLVDSSAISSYVYDLKGEPFLSCAHGDKKEPIAGAVLRDSLLKNEPEGRLKGIFATDESSGERSYYVSAQVQDAANRTVGFVVSKKPLDNVEAGFKRHPYCFLVDPDGVIFLSSRNDLRAKSLWPSNYRSKHSASPTDWLYYRASAHLLSQEPFHGMHVTYNDQRYIVTRRFFGPKGWSIIHLIDDKNVIRYRLFSIFTTLVFCGLTIVFFGALHFSREAHSNISASERRFRTLVDGSPNCIMLFDGSGVCSAVNRTGTALLLRSETDILGWPLNEIWSLNDGLTMDAVLPDILKGSKIMFEASSVGPEGNTFIWSVVLNPIHDEDGQVRSFVGIFSDITKRKETEENLRKYRENLEILVQERTSELYNANTHLQREIVERRMIEESLRESEGRFRTLFDIASDFIFLLSPSGDHGPVIVDANISACDRHGFSRSEMIGMPFLELCDAESRSRMAGIFGMLISDATLTIELKHRRKHGSAFPVEIASQPVQIGNASFILSIGRDISERRRAEELIRRLHHENELLLSSVGEGIISVDVSGRATFLNPAAAAMIGREEETIIGQDLHSIMHHSRPDGSPYHPDDCRIMSTCREGLVNHASDEVFWRKDGSRFPVEYISTPILENESVVGAVIVFRDITERKKAEEELKRHRERLIDMVEERTSELKTAVQLLTQEIAFRKNAEDILRESETKFRKLSQEFNTLLDAIPDALLLLSPELKILWANKGASVLITGAAKTTLMSDRYCHEALYQRSSVCDECYALRSFRSGGAETAQTLTPEGRMLDTRAFPIKDDDGKVTNVIVLATDITDKIKLQSEAMLASHLASLGELAAGVAHEINNPINGIINYAQLLANKLDKDSREGDISARILKEGNRVAGIVRGLLAFARESREEKQIVDVRKIVIEALTLTEAQMRKEGIQLHLDLPTDLPHVSVNSQQIQQVFLNIISNARYALNRRHPGYHPDKILEISGEKVSISGRPHARITFFDQGTGIPADIVDKVMNPFFTTKPTGMGTGLGLSISHGIISDHGGRIMLDSVQGTFTIVIIDLPSNGEEE